MAAPEPFERSTGGADDWASYIGSDYRYARWDGSQRLPDLTADDVLDALSDDLVEEGDIRSALMRLMRRGVPRTDGMPGEPVRGLDALRRSLAKQRKEALSRYRLDDVLGDIREELAAIVATERRGIERRMAGRADDDTGRDPDLERLAADL